jgi:hypothetical protein
MLTTGNITLMTPQKREIIRRVATGKMKGCLASHNTRSATYMIKKQKEHLQSFMASSECVKDVFRLQTKKEPKLVQLVDKVLH